jgi:lipopolysaccharide export system protein LptA
MIFLCVLIRAEEVEITAKEFFADELKGIAVFTGSVAAKRGKDIMKGDKITILFTKNKEITKFEAKGNAYFYVKLDNSSAYTGEANEIVYIPAEGKYTLKGKAWAEDLTNSRKVIGELITFNEKTRFAEVNGDEKPVKMIFTIKDEKNTKE